MDKNERDQLIEVLENNLDTRDKRFMFMKLSFPKLTARIQLEGSSHEAAWNMYTEFEKQCMLGSLSARLNNAFDTNIEINLKS